MLSRINLIYSGARKASRSQLPTWSTCGDYYEIKEHIFHSGHVNDEIIDSIEEHHIDLLIMGHHKSSFIKQMLSSPSEPVMRNMPCDLMFIKLDDDKD